MTDPLLPRQMSPRVEREIAELLQWSRPAAPVDFYNRIRDALIEDERNTEPAPERVLRTPLHKTPGGNEDAALNALADERAPGPFVKVRLEDL